MVDTRVEVMEMQTGIAGSEMEDSRWVGQDKEFEMEDRPVDEEEM